MLINLINKERINLPNGWVCISCGDSYQHDTSGAAVANNDNGTLCLHCLQVHNIWQQITEKGD